MSWQLRSLFFLIGLFLLIAVLESSRRRRLRVECAFSWLVTLVPVLLLILFEEAANTLAQGLGIGSALLLVMAIVAVLLTLNQLILSVVISSLVQKASDLTQKVAEMDWHISQLRAWALEQGRSQNIMWATVPQKERERAETRLSPLETATEQPVLPAQTEKAALRSRYR